MRPLAVLLASGLVAQGQVLDSSFSMSSPLSRARRLEEKDWNQVETLRTGLQATANCTESLYTVYSTPNNLSTVCQCLSCGGTHFIEKLEQTCCCLQPSSMHWACSNLPSSKAAVKSALPSVVTCRLCSTEGTMVSKCCDAGDEGADDAQGALPDKATDSHQQNATSAAEESDSWHSEMLPDMLQPDEACSATVYLVHQKQNASSHNLTSACQCQGCAGGGPGSFCCCQQPESALWSCEYLVFNSPVSPGLANLVERSLPWLLTCPLCSSPEGASTEHQCCTSAVSHLEAIQQKFAQGSLLRSLQSSPPAVAIAMVLAVALLAATSPAVRRLAAHQHAGSFEGMADKPPFGSSDEENALLHT